MCDQDHFDKDRQEYEARGLVTRKQFGVMLGRCGIWAKRLAESGYAVLVVNPFYRAKKAPTAANGSTTPVRELMPLARALSETTQMNDAKAFIGWLDRQSSVAKNRKMGTQGYCMGGPMAFRTAAAMPDRVGRWRRSTAAGW